MTRSNRAPTRVYLILSNSVFKVGASSDPQKRTQEISRQYPDVRPLHLEFICDGGRDEERAIHSALAAHHLYGEWFRRTNEAVALAGLMMLRFGGMADNKYGLHYGGMVDPLPFGLTYEDEPVHA